MTDYWTALQLTMGVEVPIAVLLFRWTSVFRLPWLAVCLAVLGVNLVTHPCAWCAAVSIPRSWAFVEGAVVVVEFLLLRVALGSRSWQAGLIAVATNGASALLSLGCW